MVYGCGCGELCDWVFLVCDVVSVICFIYGDSLWGVEMEICLILCECWEVEQCGLFCGYWDEVFDQLGMCVCWFGIQIKNLVWSLVLDWV